MTNPKPRIVIIDDDLASPTFATVEEDLRRVLSDIDAPEFTTLWQSAQRAGVASIQNGLPADQRRVAQQDTFVRAILADDALETAEPKLFEAYLSPTRRAFATKQRWFEAFRCHEAKYELKTYTAHPAPKDVAESMCVVVDLVLGEGVEFEAATNFIRSVADWCDANHRKLPLFLLISSQTSTLQTRHQEFRIASKISASGLRLIEKFSLSEESGPDLVELYISQMDDEHPVTGYLRTFCLALEKDGDIVPKELVKHIWNLDCDALLRIYRAAREDNDPFDEHLLEFLVRYLSGLLYKQPGVRSALGPVEQALASRLAPGKPVQRFYALAGNDRDALGELIESYHWLPFSDIDLSSITTDELIGDIGKFLPFGAVIADPDPVVGAEVLIHVTQPCDLLRIKRVDELSDRTLSFIRGELQKPNPESEVGGKDSKELVPALRVEGRCYTMAVNTKRPWSDSADEVWAQLQKGRKHTVARLRHDIARRIVYGYATDIMRPDTPRIAHVTPIAARIRLCLNNAAGEEFPYDSTAVGGTSIDGILETFKPERGSRERHIALRSDLAYDISLWIKSRLTKANISDGPSVVEIAMGLRDRLTPKAHHLTQKVVLVAEQVADANDPKIDIPISVPRGCARICIWYWIAV